MGTCFANLPFVRCVWEFSDCRQLRDATNTTMEVAEKYLKLQCRFFEKPYTNMNLMRGETHRTRTLEHEIRQRMSVRYPIFLGWHNLKLFAFPTKERFSTICPCPSPGKLGGSSLFVRTVASDICVLFLRFRRQRFTVWLF